MSGKASQQPDDVPIAQAHFLQGPTWKASPLHREVPLSLQQHPSDHRNSRRVAHSRAWSTSLWQAREPCWSSGLNMIFPNKVSLPQSQCLLITAIICHFGCLRQVVPLIWDRVSKYFSLVPFNCFEIQSLQTVIVLRCLVISTPVFYKLKISLKW